MAGTRGERVARVDLRRRTKKLADDAIVVSGPRSTAGKQTSERQSAEAVGRIEQHLTPVHVLQHRLQCPGAIVLCDYLVRLSRAIRQTMAVRISSRVQTSTPRQIQFT
jgi:hypothetical protein